MTAASPTRLTSGDAAPAFSLLNQRGERVTLSDLAGQRVILYAYPEASTPGCTMQACDFRDNLAALSAAGYRVIGLSPDAPEKQGAFDSEQSLGFDLLSDPDRATLSAYGAYGEKNLYGKTVVGVIRSTFVIDEQGILTHALYNVRATGHVSMLRKKLGLA